MIKRAIAALLLTACVSAAQYDDQWDTSIGQKDQVTKGQVAYWSMRGTTNTTDEIGSLNGTWSGNVASGYSLGLVGFGASFDGTNDYITFGDVLDEVIAGTNAVITISLWFNSASNAAAQFLVSKTKATANARQFFVRMDSTCKPDCLIFNDPSDGGNNFIRATGTPLTVPRWHHIVAVYDATQSAASNVLSLWVNGTINATGIKTGAFASMKGTPARLNIGTDDDTNNDLAGNVDEVRIYNRAITYDEIKQLYRMGKVIHENR